MTSVPQSPTAAQRAAAVQLLLLDVDGVLTDGRLHFGAAGEAMKSFDVRDGHGIKLLQAGGVEVAILSARSSAIVAARARELAITRVLQGEADKHAAFVRLLAEFKLSAAQCGFIGDDWPDLRLLAAVGFAATVADATAEVKSLAHWIAPAAGGRGAVRAAAEFILRAQGKFEALLQRYQREAQHA